MDPLARALRIGQGPPAAWCPEDFLRAAREGARRYRQVEEAFGIRYGMWTDAVAVIDPGYRLPSDDERAIRDAPIPERRRADKRLALWFVSWERCRATAGLPNPYEPWLAIMEHGGWFTAEHGQFVDVFDATGMPVGSVVVRRA